MKSLKLLYSESVINECLKDALAFCVDSDTDDVYFANCQSIIKFEKTSKCITSVPLNTNVTNCTIVGMDYILETQSVCIAFSGGDIIVFNILDESTQVVGSVESGLHCAVWSPDQQLLGVLTGQGTLILMTQEFDPLVEKDLHPDEFGESKPMTVGWGSKETQFHGSEGKAAARLKKPEPKLAMQWDDGKHRISWRGDGDYFVTSVIDSVKGCRILRIWSREAVLHCTSEIKDGLEHPLCWRPSGNLIACTQQHPNKHEVIFFEKNGLQHGEFQLPYPPSTFVVKELVWNTDSSLLAIWGHGMAKSNEYQITVWTINNYHWYLKQCLTFNEDKSLSIHQVLWDQRNPYRLHILCGDGRYLQYSWCWTHFHCHQLPSSVDSSVAVIDNDSVLITPFKKLIIPPPMCAYSFKFSTAVDFVTFSSSQQELAVVLCNDRIALFKNGPETQSVGLCSEDCKLVYDAAGGNGFKTQVIPYYCCGIFNIEWEENIPQDYPLSLGHWTFLNDTELLCIGQKSLTNTEKPSCLILCISSEKLHTLCETKYSNGEMLKGRILCEIKGHVIGLSVNASQNLVALQTEHGKVLKFDRERNVLNSWICGDGSELIFPSACPQFCLYDIDGKVVAFGLTERFCLYCDKAVILSNCTSFYCHDEFLLVTTCDNILKCFSYSAIRKLLDDGSAQLAAESSQQIERGARIVLVVSNDTKVVLQMPRGNLEVIHPRSLVLSAIQKYLNDLKFKEAFHMAKKHRINLNILCDDNPQKFLDNVKDFVEQISSSADLNLFIASLQDEDITKTMYSFAYSQKRDINSTDNSKSKRDIICDAIRNSVEEIDESRYFQVIIGTYAQKSNPELDKALLRIKKQRGTSRSLNGDIPNISDEALKFLICLVDVYQLYKVALGTYDLETAVMVAEKSNMDPKEYLPFLNELQELEDNFQKYKIDLHLHRYKEALVHISKCEGHFEEFLKLMIDHRLYNNALFLFPESSDQFKTVWQEYGNYLMGKMYYREAGIVYTKAGDHEKALNAYVESCDWQLALCSARKLQYPNENMHILCIAIANKLKEHQRYEEASLVLEHYVEDVEDSIVALVDGQLWESALNLMTKYNRLDIANTHLKPALLQHYENLCSSLTATQDDFIRYSERLDVVRKEKELKLSSNENEIGNLEDDLLSETTSVSGMSSTMKQSKCLSGSLVTRRSSRNKRKKELKKYRLKEGSPNEDLALLAELSELVKKTDDLKDSFFCFIRMLFHFNFIKEVKTLQLKMKEVQQLIESKMADIWKPTAKVNVQQTFGPDSTANSIIQNIAMQNSAASFAGTEFGAPSWRKNPDIFLHCLD